MAAKSQKRAAGFTLMEVLVALTILGICVGLFMCSIGGSLRLRISVLDRRGQIWRMRHAAEEAFLGLLEAGPADQGTTQHDVAWRTWQPVDKPGDDPLEGQSLEGVVLYQVAAAGLTLQSAYVDEKQAKAAAAQAPATDQALDRERTRSRGDKSDVKQLQPKTQNTEKK